MDKADVIHIYKGILFSRKRQSNAVFHNTDGLRACHIKWSKPERQMSYPYMWTLKYDRNKIVYRTETDPQRTDFQLPRVGGDEGEWWTGNLGSADADNYI